MKSKDNLKQILLPFLSYAKKATIIDPFFYLEQPRYQASLRVIARAFRERRGNSEVGKIIIHCKWQEEKKYNVDQWQKFLKKFQTESAHSIEIYGWEREDRSLKLHDRYIITNQGGLVSAAGTDKDDFQQSEWSIKDHKELNEILAQYKENSSPFRLKCCVTVDNKDY